jgi:hypothetical protein
MEDKIYNKVITIESKEESKTTTGNTMVKLTDHTGEKFNFFKKKKDGELSSPAAQFNDMRLDEGSTVKIGYVIDTYQDKNGVTRESKKIINFQETNDTPSQTSRTEKTSNGGANRASQGPSRGESQDAFSRRLGIQGHINALLSNPNVIKNRYLRPGDVPIIIETAIQIEDEAERQLNSVAEPKTLRAAETIMEPPIEAFNEDPINVEDIPF